MKIKDNNLLWYVPVFNTYVRVLYFEINVWDAASDSLLDTVHNV